MTGHLMTGTGPRRGGVLTRRAALGLGFTAAAALVLDARPARAAEIAVGDLTLTVPEDVVPVPPAGGESLGRNWQWRGRTDDRQIHPRGIVLARADLFTDEPVEVLGLLLASTAAGLLPDVRLTGRRSRPMADGRQQTRVGLSYAFARGRRYEGELAIAPRTEAPSGLVVVLKDDTLSTSFVSEVLDSVRWRS